MFRQFVYKRLETIQMYRTTKYKAKPPERHRVRVCVIDDNGFDTMGMASAGYSNIVWKDSFTNIKDFAAYDLIACDIDGVGKNIDPKREGIAVAELLKKQYPDTIVLIYSARNPRDTAYQVADGYFNKATAIQLIADEFDKYAARFWDPVVAWAWTEKKLRESGLDNKTIAFVEDVYARSLEDGINLFEKRRFKSLLSGVGNVVNLISIIASLIS